MISKHEIFITELHSALGIFIICGEKHQKHTRNVYQWLQVHTKTLVNN